MNKSFKLIEAEKEKLSSKIATLNANNKEITAKYQELKKQNDELKQK